MVTINQTCIWALFKDGFIWIFQLSCFFSGNVLSEHYCVECVTIEEVLLRFKLNGAHWIVEHHEENEHWWQLRQPSAYVSISFSIKSSWQYRRLQFPFASWCNCYYYYYHNCYIIKRIHICSICISLSSNNFRSIFRRISFHALHYITSIIPFYGHKPTAY